jgi:hypothetical protein
VIKIVLRAIKKCSDLCDRSLEEASKKKHFSAFQSIYDTTTDPLTLKPTLSCLCNGRLFGQCSLPRQQTRSAPRYGSRARGLGSFAPCTHPVISRPVPQDGRSSSDARPATVYTLRDAKPKPGKPLSAAWALAQRNPTLDSQMGWGSAEAHFTIGSPRKAP